MTSEESVRQHLQAEYDRISKELEIEQKKLFNIDITDHEAIEINECCKTLSYFKRLAKGRIHDKGRPRNN